MSFRPSLAEHYKLDAEIYPNHTIHFRKVLRVEEKERWRHVKKIGWGSSGSVWLQEKLSEVVGHREQRAVKVLEKGKMKQMNIDYMKELEALAEFRMPKILKEEVLVNFYGWFENKDKVFLAMEYFPLGDLEHHMSIHSITELATKDITVDLLKAVKLMHAEGFTHRDIKPQNILVLQNSPKWFVKLGDFGITKRTSSAVTALRTNMGTPLYSAPEIGDDGADGDDVYTNAVDLWSVGCVVYHILAQRAPFDPHAKKRPFPRTPLAGRASTDGLDFIGKLLVQEPARRLAAAEALEHPWLVDAHPDKSTSAQKIQPELSTQMSLQSWGERNSDGILTRLSTDIKPHNGTENMQVINKFRSQSELRPGGDNVLLTERQEHQSTSITQSEGYRKKTQYVVGRTKAGPDAVRDVHPPPSQTDKPNHPSEGQQRSASSALSPNSRETSPETLGIKPDPSVVDNSEDLSDLLTYKTRMAAVLLSRRYFIPTTFLTTPSPILLRRIALGEGLREASENGEIASVRNVVRYGADVECVDRNDGSHRTAIHYASISGHLDIVEFLLDSGANIHAHDFVGSTPLHCAVSEGHSGTVRLLLDRGATVDAKAQGGYTPLHEAAENGILSVAQDLLAYGADINARNGRGFTAIQLAGLHNQTDMLSMLLAADADINAQDPKGRTVLHIAALNDRKDMINLLLAENADINLQDSRGWAALHYATRNNCKDAVDLLLAGNADVNVQDKNGWAALHIAAQDDCKDTFKSLLAANADINVQDVAGWTALHRAAQTNHQAIVDLLLTAKVDVNLQNSAGWTALQIAASKNYQHMVIYLLVADPDMTVQNSDGWTALHLAAGLNYCYIVYLLLEARCPVALVSKCGKTALHCAADQGALESVELLLRTAINIGARDERGSTALGYAIDRGHEEVMKRFTITPGIQEKSWTNAMLEVYKDTNIWAKDSHGKTYLDFANGSGVPNVIERLAIARGMGLVAWIKFQLQTYKLSDEGQKDGKDQKSRAGNVVGKPGLAQVDRQTHRGDYGKCFNEGLSFNADSKIKEARSSYWDTILPKDIRSDSKQS